MAARRSVAAALFATVSVATVAAGCSSSRHRAAPAPTTTLAPDAVTVDHWAPPALAGGPSTANFCAAVTAIYRHMASLPHAVSRPVGKAIISDYIAYAPTVVAQAPPAVRADAATYLGAVSQFLTDLVRADLDEARLPAGALGGLATPAAKAATAAFLGYSNTQCHYVIGGA